MKINIFIIILLITIFFIGCSNYDQISKYDSNYPPIDPFSSKKYNEMSIYFPDNNSKYLIREERLISYSNKKVEEALIDELLNGHESKNLTDVIPKNTKLLSINTIGGIAYVNFSKHIAEFSSDERKEGFIVYSVVNTLTQLNNINKVQILIDGEIKDVLNKYYSIHQPLNFSSLITNSEYISPIYVVYQYYDSLKNKNYNNLDNLFLNKMDQNLSVLFDEKKILFDEIETFDITNYSLNNYNDNIIVKVNVKITSSGNEIINRVDEKFELAYTNKKFEINRIIEDK